MNDIDKEKEILECKNLFEASSALKDAIAKFCECLGYEKDNPYDFEELMIDDYGDYYEALDRAERIKPTHIDSEMWVAYNHFLALLEKNIQLKRSRFAELLLNTK